MKIAFAESKQTISVRYFKRDPLYKRTVPFRLRFQKQTNDSQLCLYFSVFVFLKWRIPKNLENGVWTKALVWIISAKQWMIKKRSKQEIMRKSYLVSHLSLNQWNVWMDRQSPDTDKFFSICRKGSFTDLEKWLQSHPNFVINQPEGLTGNTGLHKAALSELHSKAKTELLLNQGANPSVRNDFMETPAHR